VQNGATEIHSLSVSTGTVVWERARARARARAREIRHCVTTRGKYCVTISIYENKIATEDFSQYTNHVIYNTCHVNTIYNMHDVYAY